jgi:hypothetical protein
MGFVESTDEVRVAFGACLDTNHITVNIEPTQGGGHDTAVRIAYSGEDQGWSFEFS